MSTNELAKEVQYHVPEQPWGYHGNAPEPLQIWFNAKNGGEPWNVRFVLKLNSPGTKRIWGNTRGATIAMALENARKMQDC